MRVGGSVVGGSWKWEAGAIPVKATRPSAAQVANPGRGLSSGLIGGVDIYQGAVGDVGGRWYGGWWHDDGSVVGDSGPRETAKRGDLHCSMLSSAVHSWRVALPRASGVWTEWEHMQISQDPHHSPKSPTYHLCKPMGQRSCH